MAIEVKIERESDVNQPSGGGSSISTVSLITKETPAGAIDGANATFTTAQPYIGGSLQVYVNGLAQSNFVTEVAPSTGTFTLSEAPLTGDDVKVAYQYDGGVATTNADAVGGYNLLGILQSLFPVGSKYDSGESDTLPPLIASIGTWERFKGRVVVGVDEAQTEFDTFGKQSGAKTHTLTTAQMPSHNHNPINYNGGGLGLNAGGSGIRLSFTTGADNGYFRTADAGGGQAHNNLQPTEATYLWKRIA